VSVRTAIYMAVFLCCLTALAESGSEAANIDVRAEDLLLSPPEANWVSTTVTTAGEGTAAFRRSTQRLFHDSAQNGFFHTHNSNRLETTPVVVSGMMFVTAANDAFALDARTGRVVWHHSRAISEGLIDDASQHLNRGVAVWRDRVFMETDDAHLLCLDARSGNQIWDVAYADWNRNYCATGAPLVVKDKVLVGTSGGDDGVRGFIAAYNAMTGKLAWRFWTIPGPGEFGCKSWPGKAYLRGGGTTWMPGTYDPALNLLYWGTSNPAPDFNDDVRPGDGLYTDCMLALDADTGKLKWYFQFTPHDLFDFDAVETPMLIDADYKGEPRKLLAQANRNGYLYVLDRTNGNFLSATRFVEKLNWAKGIDERGRPIRTGVRPTPAGARVCPGYSGATNWYAPSYNESTRMVYFLALEECETFFSQPTQSFREGKEYYSTGIKRIPGETSQKVLVAYSLDTGSFSWEYPQTGRGHSSGGTMPRPEGCCSSRTMLDPLKRWTLKPASLYGTSTPDRI
jgi:alcohol dehydrogenase (cytochrome c)